MIITNMELRIQSMYVERFDDTYSLISGGVEEPTILVFRGVWSKIRDLYRLCEVEGLNPLLLDFIDPEFEYSMARKVFSLESIVKAREFRLKYSKVSDAPVRFSLDRRVDRRSLITRGPLTAIEYIDRPIIDSDLCNILDRCDLCINMCPYNALSGKPPSVDYVKCTMCGLCIGICPIEAISTPRVARDSLDWYIKILREHSLTPAYIIIAQYSDLESLYDLDISIDAQPTLVLPTGRVEEFSPLSLLRIASRGFKPVIYAKMIGEASKLYSELINLGLLDVASSIGEVNRVIVKPLKLVDRGVTPTHRGFTRTLLEELTEYTKLSFPGYADIVIDEELCTLCEVCTRYCPTGALRVESNSNKVSLIFYPDDCIGCRKCVWVCPENAIKSIDWIFRVGSEKRVLAEDKIAKCRECGAIIGSEKMIARVESRLREAGVLHALETLRLCSECKAKRIYRI
ncbi:MAG: 4Fe-4S binding protein [Acidilobaceae archaeon]